MQIRNIKELNTKLDMVNDEVDNMSHFSHVACVAHITRVETVEFRYVATEDFTEADIWMSHIKSHLEELDVPYAIFQGRHLMYEHKLCAMYDLLENTDA